MAQKPSEILVAVHNQRRPDKTVVTLWAESLPPKERDRWQEYLDAFRAMPNVNIPDLLAAVRSDEILGESFPRISSESLKKWISRGYGEQEERKG